MDDLLRSGKPVMILMWHERLWMSPFMFNSRLGKICSITTASRIAHLGRFILQRFGSEVVAVDPKKNALHANREILKYIRNGYSIAISPDGSRGPARVCKPFPLIWASKTQIPIFCVTFSLQRTARLQTWDRPFIPLPFNSGAILARRWDCDLPEKISIDQLERLSAQLQVELDRVTFMSDQKVGRID